MDVLCKTFDSIPLSKCFAKKKKLEPFKIQKTGYNNKYLRLVSCFSKIFKDMAKYPKLQRSLWSQQDRNRKHFI